MSPNHLGGKEQMHGHEVGHTGQAGHRVNFSIFFIGDVTIEGF